MPTKILKSVESNCGMWFVIWENPNPVFRILPLVLADGRRPVWSGEQERYGVSLQALGELKQRCQDPFQDTSFGPG